MGHARLVTAFSFFLSTGCGLLPGQEAPESCGFPDGTGLSYAGRSTTAALNVQEVVGDPLSDDPADIYITRDKFDQGDLHGRLVCAIFVDQPGFVEITVHPADGGRFSVEPESSATAPPDGVSRNDAVDVACGLLPDGESWEVRGVEAGPIGRDISMWEEQEWAHDLSADLWVWRVSLLKGDRGVDVVIDFVDGSAYGMAEYIVSWADTGGGHGFEPGSNCLSPKERSSVGAAG